MSTPHETYQAETRRMAGELIATLNDADLQGMADLVRQTVGGNQWFAEIVRAEKQRRGEVKKP